jgi:hypothetical protein
LRSRKKRTLKRVGNLITCEFNFFVRDPVVLTGRTAANDNFGKDMKGDGHGVCSGNVPFSQEGLM